MTGASELLLKKNTLAGSPDISIDEKPGYYPDEQDDNKSMKIKEVKMFVLEDSKRKSSSRTIVQVPDLMRIQYTHGSRSSAGPARQNFIEVVTDAGIANVFQDFLRW